MDAWASATRVAPDRIASPAACAIMAKYRSQSRTGKEDRICSVAQPAQRFGRLCGDCRRQPCQHAPQRRAGRYARSDVVPRRPVLDCPRLHRTPRRCSRPWRQATRVTEGVFLYGTALFRRREPLPIARTAPHRVRPHGGAWSRGRCLSIKPLTTRHACHVRLGNPNGRSDDSSLVEDPAQDVRRWQAADLRPWVSAAACPSRHAHQRAWRADSRHGLQPRLRAAAT